VAKKSIADNSSKVKPNFVPSEKRRAEYKRTYDSLMERAKGRVKVKGEHENHHIVPKSLGGSNEKTNIAVLTYDEHFLAHWLLTKFTEGRARLSMLRALDKMRRSGKTHKNRVLSGWQYAVSRSAASEAMSLWTKTPEGQEELRKRGAALSAFYATPEGQEVLRKTAETNRAFNATPEGQEELRKRGETRRAFNATPEGQEELRKRGETRRAFYETPEGQEVARKTAETNRAFNATPEGQAARRRSDKKRGETMRARGSKAGENHHMAKFTEELVRAIRAFNGTNKEAAEHFGISRGVIYKIRTGQRWGHVK
jgi:hypothetical protein